MTTSLPHTHIARRDLSALTAGIPYVIGFPPQDSLVLFTFARVPALTLGTTMRVDLPTRDHAEAAAEHLVAAAKMNRAIAALAVVVGGGAMDEHRTLVNALRKGFADNDILLVHTSWVPAIRHGERWQCYLDPQCTGEVPDPQTTTWAAAMSLAGNPSYGSQEEMAQQLAPDPPDSLARREELLDAHLRTPQTPYTEDELEADLALITQLLTDAEKSPDLPLLNDRQLTRLARALSHQEVKDECMAAALTPNPEAAERLWTVLVRALPAPERAEPAALLAMSAYLRGEGTLAALAVRTALDANPAHSLAQLLYAALTQAAMPPDRLRTMLLQSIMKNEGVPEDLLPTLPTHQHRAADVHAAANPPHQKPDAIHSPDRVADAAESIAPSAANPDPATPPTSAPHPTVKIRDPAWLTKLRKYQTPGAVVHPPSAWPATLPRKAVRGWRPLPEPTDSDLNSRTAATLGLLTPARTTLDPLTSFLPPQPESDAS